jgi:hypothetical protein
MSFARLLSAALCGGFLLLGSAQAQTAAREIRTCKLRLAWWSAPENLPELALQGEREKTPVSPDIMALSQVINYRGEPSAVILRKTLSAEVDKAGKPIVLWVPYCAVPIGEADTDVAVLLFPDEARGVAQTRVFNFSPEAFPYGTIQLINFTASKIAISIDGVTSVANSRSTARFPVTFSKRSVCSFKMAAAESSGEQKLLRSTTMVFKPTTRMLLFALENPGATEDARYHTEIIVDNFVSRPAPVEAVVPAAKGKAKSASEAGGKKGAKGAPNPEAPL